MVIPCGPSDILAGLLDHMIRRDGGGGNCGQIILHVTKEDQHQLRGKVDQIAQALANLAHTWPLVRSRWRWGLRGQTLMPNGPSPLCTFEPKPIAQGALHDLQRGLDLRRGPGFRLRVGCDGLALTWHHVLCDARGAQQLLATLPQWEQARGPIDDDWQAPAYRNPNLRSYAEAGKCVQPFVKALKDLRKRSLWQQVDPRRQQMTALKRFHWRASVLENTDIGNQCRRIAGRFGETYFLLGCWIKAVAETLSPPACDELVLTPLAVDLRRSAGERTLANPLGILFLSATGKDVQSGLKHLCKTLKQSHKSWEGSGAADGILAGMGFFPWVPDTLRRLELGWRGPGLAGVSLCANAGDGGLTDMWWGMGIADMTHGVSLPKSPGLGILFHRHSGCLGFDIMSCSTAFPAQVLSAIGQKLMEYLRESPE